QAASAGLARQGTEACAVYSGLERAFCAFKAHRPGSGRRTATSGRARPRWRRSRKAGGGSSPMGLTKRQKRRRGKSKRSRGSAEQPSLKSRPLPSEGTVAALAYARAASADLGFFHFIVQTVTYSDYIAYVAKEALDGKEPVKTADDLLLEAPGSRTKFLRENRQALLEMFFSRLIDNFQKYLVDVIREILRSKPKMLRTRPLAARDRYRTDSDAKYYSA